MLCYNVTYFAHDQLIEMLKNIALKSLVLFLLLSQFVTIVHALEHDSLDEENEQCFVCLHKTQFDNAILDTTSSIGVNNFAFERTIYQKKSTFLSRYSLPNNRSPPVVL